MITKTDIVAAARRMLGTPYHHQARVPQVGLDCAGLLVCVARELGIVAPNFDTPTYALSPDGYSLTDGMGEYMGRVLTQDEMQPGDTVVVRSSCHPQHLGILGNYLHGGLSIIHASNAAIPARVIETRLLFCKGMRFVTAYEFKGV